MNSQIYVKFAEALGSRRQQRRHAAVVFKFAAALDGRCQARLAAVKRAQLDVLGTQAPIGTPGPKEIKATPPPAPAQPAKPKPQPPSEWDITPIQRFHNAIKPYLNPSGLAGGALMGLGGLLSARSAFSNDSFLGRLMQMLLGGALAYGGYRVAKSPYVTQFWQKYGPQALQSFTQPTT